MHGDIWINNSTGTKNGVMITVLLLDMLIILTAALGIYGIKKAKPFLIFFFTILVGIFCVTLLGIGIFARVAPDAVIPPACSDANSTWYNDTKLLYNYSNLLCQSNCPCDFKHLDWYTPLEQDIIKAAYPSRTGTLVSLQGCTSFTNIVKNLGSLSILQNMDQLGAIEQYLNCTGWCNSETTANLLFSKFSNVNNGKATDYCYTKMRSWIVNWSEVVGYSCFAIAGALLLVFICNMCICCHPDRRTRRITERFHHEPSGGSAGYIRYGDY